MNPGKGTEREPFHLMSGGYDLPPDFLYQVNNTLIRAFRI